MLGICSIVFLCFFSFGFSLLSNISSFVLIYKCFGALRFGEWAFSVDGCREIEVEGEDTGCRGIRFWIA